MGSFGQAIGTGLGFEAADAISGAILGKNKREKRQMQQWRQKLL